MNNHDEIKYDQINKIINVYLSNGCKLWHMGTNFYKSWERFHNVLIENFEAENFNFANAQIKCISSNKEDNKYIFLINGIELKAYRKKEQGWSLSALRQFLQQADAFGYIITNFEELRNLKKNEKMDCFLIKDFYEIFKSDFLNNFDYLLLKSMQKALFSVSKHVKNLGFTLFMVYIDLIHINYELLDNVTITKISNKKIENQKNNKNLKLHSDEYKKYMKRVEDHRKTYECLLSFTKIFEFNKVIESLIYSCDNNYTNIILTKNEGNNNKFKSDFEKLSLLVDNLRSQLRKNIIKSRVNNKLKYNDLENTKPIEWYVDDCEAAHIYNIWNIKEEVRKKIEKGQDIETIQKFINEIVADPNNGILLLKQWHHYFDRDYFYFNINGELIISLNIEKDRLEPINLSQNGNVKIKCLSEKMKNYLSLRNKNNSI